MKECQSGVGTALAPCTCGELVQGFAAGDAFLVSCPIDRYSRVTARLGPAAGNENPSSSPKARRAARCALHLLGYRETRISLEVACPLPPSKGFGTSTADVVAAILATAAAVGGHLSPHQVADLAVAVEPSDGTMFQGLALFSHRTGQQWESLGSPPPLWVAVLEFSGEVDTLKFNRELDIGLLRSLETEHARALATLREGLRLERVDLVGRAATHSARTNQRLLFKPALEQVIGLGHDCRGLGVCAAHSGTALGVLFAPEAAAAAEAFLGRARQRLEGLERAWLSRLVGGGGRLLPTMGAATTAFDAHESGKAEP